MTKLNYINDTTIEAFSSVLLKSTYHSLSFISSILYHYNNHKFTNYKYIGISNDSILKAHNLEGLNHKSVYLFGGGC